MKKYIAVLFLIAFIIPSVASAVWWNPISWFKSNPSEVRQNETSITETQPNLVTQTAAKPTEEVENQKTIVERIIEKPTIQTITVQDPVLQLKINTLIAENEALRKEIIRLKEEMADKVNASSAQKPEEKWCSTARADYYDIQASISKLQKEKLAVANSFVNCGTQCNSELVKFKTKEDLLRIEESAVKKDITAYCD